MQAYEATDKQIVIALAADLNYSEQVITLIKSVCYHHQNVKFYLLNKEFPDEWFQVLNKSLNKIECQIIDVKVITDIFDGFTVLNRITSPTCYRYFISDLPEDRILYLDCDIVIDDNIDEFYSMDFKDNLVMATEDPYTNSSKVSHSYEDFPDMKPYFGAGVLLVNNKLWKEQNITATLCEYTLKYPNLIYLDQDVLNIVCKNKWGSINKIYNYQLHAKVVLRAANMLEELAEFDKLATPPKIIHFTGPYKPWLNIKDEVTPEFRTKYWFYNGLEWSDIIQKHISC
ncbi:glycosyltransferase family 8 protein [Pasteurellaceae bacterium 22721_9_1]